MSDLRRILSGTFANFLNFFYFVIVTGASVPLLTHAWGLSTYGIWLMLTTVPTYLALSDLGFASAATNDIALHFAVGERQRALTVFQTVWVLTLLVSGAALILAGGATALAASISWPHQADGRAYGPIIMTLVLYSVTCMLSRVLLAGFRGTGRYTQGTLIYDALQFGEGLAVLSAATFGGGFLMCVSLQLVLRIVSLASLWILLSRRMPWLKVGVAEASWKELKRLLKPALGAFAIPSALALNLQGVAIVVGLVLMPSATAVLVSVRTASRVAIQLISSINRATAPELSRSFAQGDEAGHSRIMLINVLSVTCLLFPAGVAFALLGGPFVHLWSGGKMSPDPMFVALMAAAMVLNGCWYFGVNLLLATNSHTPMSMALLTTAGGAVLLSAPAARFLGLPGAALVLALCEGVNVLWFARCASRSHTRLPNMREMLALLRGFGGYAREAMRSKAGAAEIGRRSGNAPGQ